jgi:hypothetical protein
MIGSAGMAANNRPHPRVFDVGEAHGDADARGGRLGDDFDEFFRREYPRLLSTMFLTCGDRAEAEDLAQAAMVRALERWETVSAVASPARYVYRIAFDRARGSIPPVHGERVALGRLTGGSPSDMGPLPPSRCRSLRRHRSPP